MVNQKLAEERRISVVLALIFLVLTCTMILFLFHVSYSIMTTPTGEKEVKCYDRDNSEIVGQVCIKTITDNEKIGQVFCISLISIFVIVFLGSITIDLWVNGI
jgi:hypothetical protein